MKKNRVAAQQGRVSFLILSERGIAMKYGWTSRLTSAAAILLCLTMILSLAGCASWSQSRTDATEFQAYYTPLAAEDIAAEGSISYASSQLLLTSTSGAAYQEIEALAESVGGKIGGYISATGDYQILLDGSKAMEELEQLADRLRGNALVEEATLAYVAQFDAAVDYTKDPWLNANDPSDNSGSVWDEDAPSGNNWWAEAIGMPSVWNMDITTQTVKVGIIDSMFDVTNEDLDEDLFAKTWNNPVSESGDCRVTQIYNDAVAAYSQAVAAKDQEAAKQASARIATVSHGTHVAGTIAAQAENGFGIAGVNQNVKLYGYSVLSDEAAASEDGRWGHIFLLKCAIAQLLNEGVKVINISMAYDGALVGTQDGEANWKAFTLINQKSLESFLLKYIEAGKEFLIVKSAGNDSTADKKYDAGNDIFGAITNEQVAARIIMVGAAKNDSLFGLFSTADFSNTGTRVNVYAPGVDILSDIPANATASMDGTSMAAPIVTGLASLAWGINPDLSAVQVRSILLASANATMLNSDDTSSVLRNLVSSLVEPVPIVNAKLCVQLAQAAAGTGNPSDAEFGTISGAIYGQTPDGSGFANINVKEIALYSADGTLVSTISPQIVAYPISDNATGEDTLCWFPTYFALVAPGTYDLRVELQGYEAQVRHLTVAANDIVRNNFVLTDMNTLVTDAYSIECAYTSELYNQDSGSYEETELTAVYRIPKINLSGTAIEQLNAEIYDALYPQVEASIAEIAEYGLPITSEGISYRWAVNDDILSLVILNSDTPEYGFVSKSMVYNVSIFGENTILLGDLLSAAGIMQETYYDILQQALGSEFFQGKAAYVEQVGYDDFFRKQLEKTLSEENLRSCVPYLNEKGQLCVIAAIYSIAAADFYYHDINLEDFDLDPAFQEYVSIQAAAANSDSYIDRYRAVLLQHPASTEHTYGSDTTHTDTEYVLHDIDKDGIPELIVKVDGVKYYVYSFNGTDVVASDKQFWSYADCLYAYDGNGIVVHDGGFGKLHLENASLYSLLDGKLAAVKTLMGTEDCSLEELNDFLDRLTPIDDFRPVTEFS